MKIKGRQNSAEEIESANLKAEIGSLRDELVKKFLLRNCTNCNVPLKSFMKEFEKEMISRALNISGGNQRVASFVLGLKPTTLNEKIRKFQIKESKRIRGPEDLEQLLKSIYISSF